MSSHAGHGHHDTHAADIDWDILGPLLEQEAELNGTQYEEAARWIAALPTAPKVRRVLDIGSGPGVVSCLLAEVFPEAEVVAVDATPALLERARNRARRLGVIDRFRTLEAELPRNSTSWGSRSDLGGQLPAPPGRPARRAGGLRRAPAARRHGRARRGGLPARRLPRDIGIGQPGLEARMTAAAATRFERMRSELPGAKREIEDWAALFTAVGLAPQGTRSFLLDLPAPLSRPVRDHVVASIARERDVLGDLLTAEDSAVLDRLLDPEDPEGLHHRPDVHLLAARTVHLGRRGD